MTWHAEKMCNEESEMKIWKLTPIDLTDRNWDASTHSDVALVRAETSERARAIAQLAFALATERTPGQESKLTPWKYEHLVACELLVTADYPVDGEEGVLLPEYHERAHLGES